MLDDFEFKKLTPMLKHYVETKNDFKDALLLYRVGDFYESFFEDAIIISKELQLALTGKDCGHDKRAPMCGVPHHVIDTYVNKLVKKGHKVAICDQIEDPKLAKGLVKRAITRIVTPGTITDVESIDKSENNFLMSIFDSIYGIAASFCDVTTGKITTFELRGEKTYIGKSLIDQIAKINPSEIILNADYTNDELRKYIENNSIFINYIDRLDYDFDNIKDKINEHIGKENLKKIISSNLKILSVNNLLDYIYNFQNENLTHINDIEILEVNNYLQLDRNTRKNLELHKNLNNNTKVDSVINIIDKTDTAMGSRLINQWLERPLLDKKKIEFRLDLVEFLVNNFNVSKTISNYLDDIYDLERLIGKISYNRCNARDFISLKNSIRNIPSLKNYLTSLNNKQINLIGKNLFDLKEIYELLSNSIVDDPPITISEGSIIKKGYNNKLDNLKTETSKAKKDLIEYENDQKELTGIKNYKIKYNKNNGYSIEITKSNLDKVPDNYIRKQTLKNQERYTTERLEEISELILEGTDKINEFELEIFEDIRSKILKEVRVIQNVARILANIDAMNSLSKVALKYNYTRPKITNDNIIKIKNGRHPIIENKLKENEFISNDTDIGEDNNLIQIITGPNMAGKSTYMRQTAIIIILAQMGSFVPCDSASISICDKVFTRIGASDNISKGESTFMLEMKEVSNILKNATKDSFVVLDEVGRGTSTDDGLSIAMSLVDYLSKITKVKTVFATHFHELTVLEKRYPNVVNLKINIEEKDGKLIFLRKISRGKSDQSYGIEVAQMAGLPDMLINNAKLFMEKLDYDNTLGTNLNKKEKIDSTTSQIKNNKLNFLKDEIKKLDVNSITPLESMSILNDLIERVDQL